MPLLFIGDLARVRQLAFDFKQGSCKYLDKMLILMSGFVLGWESSTVGLDNGGIDRQCTSTKSCYYNMVILKDDSFCLCSRPWLCYWILHSLALLGESVDCKLEHNAIDFLSRCQVRNSFSFFLTCQVLLLKFEFGLWWLCG